MFSKKLINNISERTSIVTIISRYINIQKKGKLYVGLCPFHNDTHPSLQINPERNTFKCWVDGHCGNAFSFIMQYEHVNFIEAVKKVADIIGFDDNELHENNNLFKKNNHELKTLSNCINDLNAYYEYSLNNSEEGEIARNYLKKRHLSLELAKKFHIGYAINDGIKTINFLRNKGYSIKTIEDIGITNNNGENTYDYNHGRLTFAITDYDGQIIGFSSRTILNNENNLKYFNSPETKLFVKKKQLYNIFNAKKTIKIDKFLYLLEGFMDVIALSKININSAIALMGTNLSKENILTLRKLNVEIRLCLDGDSAGQEASLNIVKILIKNNINVMVVNNFDNKNLYDPDEILNLEGADKLKKYLNNLLTPFEFIILFYKNYKKLNTINDRKKIINYFLPFLNSLKSQFELDDYIDKLSKITNFSFNAIKNAINNIKKKKNTINNQIIIDHNNFIPKNKKLRILEKAEREIIFHMFNNAEVIAFYKKYLFCFFTPIYKKIANCISEYFSQNQQININGLITFIEMHTLDDKIAIKNEIINIINEEFHLPYSQELLFEYKKIIDQEKEKISKIETVKKLCFGKSDKEKAIIINEYFIKNNYNT